MLLSLDLLKSMEAAGTEHGDSMLRALAIPHPRKNEMATRAVLGQP